MRSIYVVPVLVLALIGLMAPVIAVSQDFQAGDGDSGYQGIMVMDEDGNFAFSMVAVVGGTIDPASTVNAEENDGVHAGQQSDVEGDGAFAASGAANADGSTATTADVALGPGSIYTTQGAAAEDDEVGAGQSSTLVEGDSVFAGSLAVEDARDNEGDIAYSMAAVEDGSLEVSHQGAGYEEGNTAGAGQSVIAIAEEAYMETGAESACGDSAFTFIGYEVPEESATPGFAQATQHASAGNSAEAEQFGVVGITNGGSAEAGTEAYASDGNSAGTSASLSTPTAGALAIQEQEAEASGYATAEQDVVVGSSGHAEASSWAADDDGCSAETEAEVYRGGLITTEQGAAAGDVGFFPVIYADGAAAGQITELFATNGGSIESSATESGRDENYAETEAEIHGTGSIDSVQGAAAGFVVSPVFGVAADGAAAAQWSDLESTRGGEVSSYASNGDPNEAWTEAEYHGEGSIDDTIQGAAAGDVRAFGEGSVEGAIAIQHTDVIEGFSASASSSAQNGRENSAGTETYAIGNGRIEDTTQGAVAGEGRINDLHLEVEGAAAGQYTEQIDADFLGGAETWARNGRENWASTEAGFHGDGAIEGTLQVAGAGEVEVHRLGEVEGAIAIQHTDVIDSGDEQTAWASSESRNGRENEAGTSTIAYGRDGLILDTTQGAVAGEGRIYPFGLEAEGAAAGQFTGLIDSEVGGSAETWARNGRENSASTEAEFHGSGAIEGTLQVAGAGEVESPFFGLAGAGAFQHTDNISVDDGFASARSEAGQRHSNEGSAETGAAIRGDGYISGTTQGATAGEFESFLFEGAGAAAGQFTDDIVSSEHGAAWSNANNERENRAGTSAEFDGVGIIDDTIQGAAAGEVEGWFFDVEGAAAGQYTGFVASTDGGETESWASSRDPSRASTEAGYEDVGFIDDAIQGAAAGQVEFGRSEIEGAIAVQDINAIFSTDGGWATSSAEFREWSRRSSRSAEAESTVEFDDQGTVTGLTQGAVAGEFDLEGLFDVYGEGAVAGQHFDSLTSFGNPGSVFITPLPTGSGFAETSASTTESGRHWSSTDEASVFAGETEMYWNKLFGTDTDYPGFVNGVTQIAGAGEVNIEDPLDLELEGAAAVQGVDSGSYLTIVPTHLLTSYASHDGDDEESVGVAVPGTGGFSYGAAGEVEDGFGIEGAIAGWLPFNPF